MRFIPIVFSYISPSVYSYNPNYTNRLLQPLYNWNLLGRFWKIIVGLSSTYSDLNVQVKQSTQPICNIIFCVQRIFNNGRKIVGIVIKVCVCYRFFFRFLRILRRDASAREKIYDNLLQEAKSARQIHVCKRSFGQSSVLVHVPHVKTGIQYIYAVWKRLTNSLWASIIVSSFFYVFISLFKSMWSIKVHVWETVIRFLFAFRVLLEKNNHTHK
jgi:hypothetical protein